MRRSRLDEDWRALAYKQDGRGRQRVLRMIYEIASFQALRDRLRCKEIWVVGADRWRNPDEDLPSDFQQRRGEHYKALQKPLDPAEFIAEVRTEMQAELAALHEALPGLPFLEITDRGKQGAIKLTPLKAQPDPPNLNALKRDMRSRWGMVALIDMLKESILRTGCLEIVSDLARGARLSPETLAHRLMLAIYGYGTNIGIRGVAAGDHGHSEDDLRYVCRRLLTPELVRSLAIEIANTTFAARAPARRQSHTARPARQRRSVARGGAVAVSGGDAGLCPRHRAARAAAATAADRRRRAAGAR